MHGHEEIDVNKPLHSPGLSEHRESILAELMGGHGAYDLPEDDETGKRNKHIKQHKKPLTK